MRSLRSLAVLVLLFAGVAAAADAPPGLWNPNLHPDAPDLSGLKTIRFLTADDYPPLDFEGPDGSPTGFNVEIARAACEQLRLVCTIQARRWDTLPDALETGKGDAMIASMRATPAMRAKFAFTAPYYLTPARFAARADSPLREIDAAALAGKTVGVVAKSAHEAYLAAFFPEAQRKPYEDFAALHKGLKAHEVDAIFADGVTLAVWLAGEDAADCCAFRGGPYLESRFFGEGVSIAVRRDDASLRRALDWALWRVGTSGRYAELYRKYFSISFY